MSRLFSTNASVTLSPGALVNALTGAVTVLIVWKPASVHFGGMAWLPDSGNSTVINVNPFFDGFMYYSSGGGFRSDSPNGGYNATDGWYMWAVTKAAGTVTPRFHRCIMSSDTWAHADASGTLNNAPGNAIDHVLIGQASSGEKYNGRLAAIAIFNQSFSDGQIEAMRPGLADWLDNTPLALWAFNQASTSDPILDLTGNGADQTALVNTSVDADDPPNFSYTTASEAVLDATLPTLTGSVAARGVGRAALTATLPSPLTAALAGDASGVASLAGALPGLTAAIDGAAFTEAALAGTLPGLTALLTGLALVPTTRVPELGGSAVLRELGGLVEVR